jgi:hypothetical protein
VWLLASGLEQDPDGMDAAVVMTRWMFPYIGFMSLVALSAGVLNTWKRFAVSAATPVLLNLSMIGGLVAGALLPVARHRTHLCHGRRRDAGRRAAAGGADSALRGLGCCRASAVVVGHSPGLERCRVRRILRLMGRRCWAWAWRRSA